MPTISQDEARRMGIPTKSIQTVLFPRHDWDVRMAKKWLKNHNYVNSYYRKTPNFIRFMQNFPIQGAHYISHELANGVQLVLQHYGSLE